MKDGLTNISKRKRAKKKNQIEYPYPAKDPRIRFLDKLILLIAFGAPLFNIPQIVKIWSTQTSAGVSILTFLGFALIDIPWIIYGVVHKDKPTVITFSFWFITNVIVIISALVFM